MQRTDLRVMKTLKQIDGALLSCLADTPYDKITVDQLCRETMINRSTFYKYYTGKHDLMERFLRRALEGFRRQVDVAFVEASPETIQDLVYRRSFENTLHFLFRHKAEYELLWSLPLQDGVFGQDDSDRPRRHSGQARGGGDDLSVRRSVRLSVRVRHDDDGALLVSV